MNNVFTAFAIVIVAISLVINAVVDLQAHGDFEKRIRCLEWRVEVLDKSVDKLCEKQSSDKSGKKENDDAGQPSP